jgi:hypothetical protein
VIFLKIGLIEINWNEKIEYSDEDITYFLFLEGKSIDSISKIRSLSKEQIQMHIVSGKIKYGYLSKCNDIKELFNFIKTSAKIEKINILRSIEKEYTDLLVYYIINSYNAMLPKDKEAAVWILGELKVKTSIPVLMRASVHSYTNIRRMAVSALGKIGDKSCEDTLIRALGDSNDQVKLYAIKALGKIESNKGLKKMGLFKNSNKQYLRNAAEEFIASMEKDV